MQANRRKIPYCQGETRLQSRQEILEEKEMPRKWVFAVHRYETGDHKHHVSYGTGNKYRTKRFSTWPNARKFAQKKAQEMNLRKFQIDTPHSPHKMVPTASPKTRARRCESDPVKRALRQLF